MHLGNGSTPDKERDRSLGNGIKSRVFLVWIRLNFTKAARAGKGVLEIFGAEGVQSLFSIADKLSDVLNNLIQRAAFVCRTSLNSIPLSRMER